jgi:hypothetical protein
MEKTAQELLSKSEPSALELNKVKNKLFNILASNNSYSTFKLICDIEDKLNEILGTSMIMHIRNNTEEQLRKIFYND